MYVKFQKLKWKNVLSYGSHLEEFDFKKGLHLISGTNGEGKSAILDVLSYCLYGSPYRKIKIKELINRRNRRNLYTEVTFSIDGSVYKIVRRMLPNKIEVYKNDEPIELLSSKKLTQGEIDKILGVDYHLFKQIISLAINYNKPFLSLTTNEKRGIIESIFNIKIFGEMLKILKKKNSGFKLQANINNKTINILENTLRNTRKQLKDTKRAIKDFDKNKNMDLKRVIRKIETHMKDIEKLNESTDRKKVMLEKIVVDIEPLRQTKKDITKKINIANYNIETKSKDVSALQENETCPLCNIELTEDHRKREIRRLNSTIKNAQIEIDKNTKRLNRIENKISVAEHDIEKKNTLSYEITRNSDKIRFMKKQLEELKDSKREIEERQLHFDIDSMEKMFEEKKDEYTTIYSENKLLLKEMRNNDIAERILSERVKH